MGERERMEASAGKRLALIAASYAQLTGKPLIAEDGALWTAPRAVVARGTETPPLFFYGTAVALGLFRMSADEFIGLPSHRSAEAAHRAERARMFERLKSRNVIADYHGIRIAADGTRFLIGNAVIWNLVDRSGRRHGQAAAFAEWTPL